MLDDRLRSTEGVDRQLVTYWHDMLGRMDFLQAMQAQELPAGRLRLDGLHLERQRIRARGKARDAGAGTVWRPFECVLELDAGCRLTVPIECAICREKRCDHQAGLMVEAVTRLRMASGQGGGVLAWAIKFQQGTQSQSVSERVTERASELALTLATLPGTPRGINGAQPITLTLHPKLRGMSRQAPLVDRASAEVHLVGPAANEAVKFTPTLRPLALHGPGRHEAMVGIDSSDLVITTFPLITRGQEVLTAHTWSLLVIDEAQYVKNPKVKTRRALAEMDVPRAIVMTGPPLENRMLDLWSQIDLGIRGFLDNMADFRRRYSNPIELHGDPARQENLNRRLASSTTKCDA